jgi:hypothetical protein
MIENRSKAMIPGFVSSSIVKTQLSFQSGIHIKSLYQYSGLHWSLNKVKGDLVENALPRIIRSGFLESAGVQWTAITPHRSGPCGIDALFVRVGKNGHPSGLMVAEAKFGVAKLGMTKDGIQMGETWVRTRLVRTAHDYHTIAQAFDNCTVIRGYGKGLRQTVVPLQNGSIATVSIHKNELFLTLPEGVSRRAVQRQARLCGDYCLGAGEGKIDYRSRLFRMNVKGNRWTVAMDKLDPISGRPLGDSSRLSGEYRKLPRQWQRLVKQNLTAILRSKGIQGDAADELAEQICRNPSWLRQTQLIPKVSWGIGIDRGMAVSMGGAVLTALIMEGLGYIVRGDMDGKRLAKVALASAVSAGVGYYVGAQVQTRMIGTEVGKRLASAMPTANTSIKLLGGYGGVAAGVVTSVLFAGIGYGLGLMSAKDAKITAVSGVVGSVAGLGFTYGTLSIVTAYGTAGTGVAISSLSGAAASNAALATLGGGTIAGGGGGIAAGMTVLTGGAALIGVAAFAAISFGAKLLDERERRLLVLGKLNIVERSLS